MRFDNTHRNLGNVPYKDLLEFALTADESLWDSSIVRSELFEVHKKTKAIVFRFTPDATKLEFKTYPEWKIAGEVLMKTIRAILKIQQGMIVRCMIAKLPPKSVIIAHTDESPVNHKCHRLHVPLINNDNCVFTVGHDIVDMTPGSLIEINNQITHGVVNNGDEDRLQLIVDILPTG